MGCHFLLQCMKVKSEREVAQLCLTLRDPMHCSLPGSSIHRIFQARVLEWGAIAVSEYICLMFHKMFSYCCFVWIIMLTTYYCLIHFHLEVTSDGKEFVIQKTAKLIIFLYYSDPQNLYEVIIFISEIVWRCNCDKSTLFEEYKEYWWRFLILWER